jgi:hypothetical protein
MYICVCVYIYIYIEREREREREIGIICLHKLLSRKTVKCNFTRDGRFFTFSILYITIHLL